MASYFAKPIALSLFASLVEKKGLPKTPLAVLGEESSFGGLPRGFGLVTVILTVTCLWMLIYGFMAVGDARSKYKELAKKDGEKDVEERYSFPNLYAQGTTKHVKAFNCVQRSHQHVMETFPGYLLLSCISAASFPVSTAIMNGLWFYSRLIWAAGYCNPEGDPGQRYSKPFSSFHWTAFLTLVFLSIYSSINMLVGSAFFWNVIGGEEEE